MYQSRKRQLKVKKLFNIASRGLRKYDRQDKDEMFASLDVEVYTH